MSYEYAPLTDVLRPNLAPFMGLDDVSLFVQSGEWVGMWWNGCWYEDGVHNCTAVCTEPERLYGFPPVNATLTDGRVTYTNATNMWVNELVPYNLYNCMYYPYVSWLLTDPSTSATDRKAAENLAAYFHILPNASSIIVNDTTLLQKIRSVQWDCVSAFCTSGQECGEGYALEDFISNNTAYQKGPGMSTDSDHNMPQWNLISSKESMEVNGDIAGIGVSIAFGIEAAVILLCWLFVWFKRYRNFLENVENARFRRLHAWLTAPFHGLFTGWQRNPKPLQNPNGTEQPRTFTSTILTAMSSFQSAQCFFLIAMNAAILAGLFQENRSIMGSVSLGEAWNNVLYVQIIGEGGIAFVVLTQYCLHSVKESAFYYMLLTLVTYAIGIKSYWLGEQLTIRRMPLTVNLQTANPVTDTWQLQCGMVSPQTYNNVNFRVGQILGRYPWVTPYQFGRYIVIIGTTVLAGLLLDYIWSKIMSFVKSKAGEQLVDNINKWYRYYWFIFCFLTEVFLWLWIIFFIMLFWIPQSQVIRSTWSIGQILSVTVWIPGFIEWIYATLKLVLAPRVKYQLLSRDRAESTGIEMSKIARDHDDEESQPLTPSRAEDESGMNVKTSSTAT